MFDHLDAGQATAGPGQDTRSWVSHGTVDNSAPGNPSVTFTPQYGPLVRVTLHPSGTPVVCRVAHAVGGNGEGEWHPFVSQDEVLVSIPEGDETAGCVIVGRLNNEIDQWPAQVAGNDSTKNNFSFRRLRTPYVVETASSYLVRSATSGAFFGISADGEVTISNADNAFLAVRPDFVGMQNGPGDVLFQIDVGAKQFVAEAAGTKFVLDADTSYLYTSGVLQLGTSGNQASEHATSIESIVVLLQAFFTALGALSPGPLTGAGVAGAFVAAMNAAIESAPSLPIAPYGASLQGALGIPKTAGVLPGVAAPGLLI
jgi:hypothetical protein